MRRFLTSLAALSLLTATLLGCSSTWYPSDEDPVYTDEDGVTWGLSVDGVDPDMLLVRGDDDVVGYLNAQEADEASWKAQNELSGTPGVHEVPVVNNLYEFLTYEVVGTETSLVYVTIEAETPDKSANSWYPEQPGDVSTTDDGRTWGLLLPDGSCDMEFVMASDTGSYGFISSEDRKEAEEEAMASAVQGNQATVMLDVVLYDTDTVVGQYAVTAHA